MLRTLLLAASLTAGFVAPLAGQAGPRHAGPRAQLDYFVSRFEVGPAAPQPVDGLGGRLMWAVDPARVRLPVPAAWAGVYALHTPRDEGFESWRLGAQADAALVRTPRWLPLQPTVTLGAGVVHVSRPVRTAIPLPHRPPVPLALAPASDRSGVDRETGLSLAPGIGARVTVSDGSGLRADLRRVWDFRRTRAAATELSAGVTLPL